MASRKPRRPNNQYHAQHSNQHNNHNQSQGYYFVQPGYESDHAYLSDPQQILDQQNRSMASAPPRTNEELNLSVLQRHNPAVRSIQSIAPFAVVYTFSPTTRQWEKTGVEGTLFVCQLEAGGLGEERYSVFVLNRRGLNNFDLPLTDGENVEITEEYIILKSDLNPDSSSTRATSDIRIYGLWVFSEPPPSSTAETRNINAQVIRECASIAGQSLKLARERLEAARQNGLHTAAAAASATIDPLDGMSSVPMGRQISLRDLFGHERAQDDGWSVRAHSQPSQAQVPPATAPTTQPDVLGDLFRRSGLARPSGPNS
ncbi:Dcp1 family protein [Aspergillus stella-maris]|uniref:Dcp1 family protein n=1 Tax=Aspergillus stella-maris TaxID=1810926 RepID=UPI003CCD855F